MGWNRIACRGIAALLVTSAAGAANAADVVRAPPPVQVPVKVAPAFSWHGLYVGLHGGYAFGRTRGNYDDPTADGLAGPLALDPKGWFGGGQIGVNSREHGPWVFGIEADASWGDVNDTIPDALGDIADAPGPYFITGKTDSSGTLRGRIGLSQGRVLPYFTAGWAWAHSSVTSTDGPVSQSATLSGWTAGAGIEVAHSDRVSYKIEYLYADFGNHTWFAGEDYSSTVHSTSNAVRFGVNFHF